MTEIGLDTFKDCTSLIQINIPESVTEIQDSEFKGCTSLIQITIPEGVTEIGFAAFLGCTSLTQIHIPESVTKIDCEPLNSLILEIFCASSGNKGLLHCTSFAKGNIVPAACY